MKNGNTQMNGHAKRFCAALVIAAGLSLGALSASAEEANTWKINLKEADIRNFIEQVSDITGQSFIVDQRVKGNVTVVSAVEMSREEINELFQAVLRMHGFATVQSGPVVRIVMAQSVKQEGVPIISRPYESDEVVTHVVAVENTNAVELVPILRPLVPQYGHLAAVSSANALVISDHVNNIQRIIDIVKQVDRAESEEVEVISLKHAWVGDVVSLLEELTPIESGQAVQPGRSRSASAGSKVRVVAEERTNRLILRGERSARDKIKILVNELDVPGDTNGSTHVIYLRHANAEKTAELLRNIVTGISAGNNQQVRQPQQQNQNAGNDVQIQADEALNALVVRAAPSEISSIREIVDQLDVRRAQVLIEAAIVEVTGNAGKAVGIQWGSANENNAVAGANFTNVGNSLDSIIKAALTDTGAQAASLANGLTLAGGVVGDEGNVEFAIILQALNNASNANLLSTPSLMTLDNEEAEIIVGQNVPFVTGSQLSQNNSNPFQTIERRDVGLTLKVTPQINDGDVVRLQVAQEASAVVQTAEGIQVTDVVTNKRAINTTVLANDGEIIVLGGLMQDDVQSSVSKIPLLGDIPFLGALFRSTNKSHVKRNLLVFLQPTIIRGPERATEVSARQYDRVREVHLQLDSVGRLRTVGEDIYPTDARQLLENGLKDPRHQQQE